MARLTDDTDNDADYDPGPKRVVMYHVHGLTLEMIMQTMDPEL
ncbi:unnamed protein product, partial [Protopolystoma xenopodis]